MASAGLGAVAANIVHDKCETLDHTSSIHSECVKHSQEVADLDFIH